MNHLKKKREKILLKAYSYLYSSLTYRYVYYRSQNKYECARYEIEPQILNFIDYLKIAKKFRKDYINYLSFKNYKVDLKMKIGILRAYIVSLLGVIKEKIKNNKKINIKEKEY